MCSQGVPGAPRGSQLFPGARLQGAPRGQAPRGSPGARLQGAPRGSQGFPSAPSPWHCTPPGSLEHQAWSGLRTMFPAKPGTLESLSPWCRGGRVRCTANSSSVALWAPPPCGVSTLCLLTGQQGFHQLQGPRGSQGFPRGSKEFPFCLGASRRQEKQKKQICFLAPPGYSWSPWPSPAPPPGL